MSVSLAPLLCFASGFALVSLGWSRREPLAIDLLLRASLSVGFGFGIFSVEYFVCRAFSRTNLLAVDLAVLALLAAALVFRSRFLSAPSQETKTEGLDERPVWFRRTVAAAFVFALFAAIYLAIQRVRIYPNGDGWDAFAIWNLHARFLFLGGSQWRDGFTALLPGSHPDYPLLLPAAIAHFWSYFAHDDPRIPSAIGFAFTFATAGVLFATLAFLRGRVAAMIGAIVLLSTPSFIEQGTAQYADVPLSFFFLACVVLLCLGGEERERSSSGLLALAGVAAAFAAWTKNEGLLFLCALAFARVAILARRRTRTALASEISTTPLPAVLVPALLLILYYKHFVGVPGDLFSSPSASLHRLLDSARYWAVIKWYVKGFFRFGHWFLLPVSLLLLALALSTSRDISLARQPGSRTAVFAIALTVGGYFLVFLITPYDIYWHLRFSLLRLFLQVWPATVFLVLANVRTTSAPNA